MKIYTVYEEYDNEGEFGDAVPEISDWYTFAHKEDAYAFKQKYNNPHMYNKTSIAEFWCGTLEVREIEILDHFDPNAGIEYESYGDMMKRLFPDIYNIKE